MADLTDITQDIIITCPDAKTMDAYTAWYDKLNSSEKANFAILAGKYVVSVPDPEGVLDEVRKELMTLVDDNAESATDVIRLRFDGTNYAAIINKAAYKEG